MGKICLIRPPRVVSKASFNSGGAIPPLGMAYLVSSLKESGFEVEPIDAVGEEIEQYYELSDVKDAIVQGMDLDAIVDRIPRDSLVIGLSCMFSCEWFLYEALIYRIRASFPDTPIVLGGEHATAEALNILKVCPAVDVCVSGEGEETLVELARAYESGSSIQSIAGISFRKGPQLVSNTRRARIKNINAIPSPSWEKIPVQNYHRMGNSMTAVNRRAMPVIASRGCPFRCTFCTSPQMWGTEMNLRSPQAVLDEIRSYKEQYDIDHIDFVDLVGVLNRAWAKEFLTLLIAADLKLTWILGAGTRSEILDPEILDLFKRSNVLRIFYAPESGSKATLERIKKRVNLGKITSSMREAERKGISIRAPLIYGFPGQTLKEAFENLFFSFKLSFMGVDDVVAHAFSAYPGTELFHQLISQGDIDIEDLMKNGGYNDFLRNEFTTRFQNLHSWSSHIPSWAMPLFQYGGMLVSYGILFLFHPHKFFRSLYRVFFRRKPLTFFDHALYGFLVERGKRKFAQPRLMYGPVLE